MLIDKIRDNIAFRALLHAQTVIMVVTVILAGGIVFAGVFLRYILGKNFFGQEEVLCVVAMWLYWVGGIYGSYEGTHIKGDLLSTFFKSPKAKKAIELVNLAVSFAVIAFFCKWGWEYMSFNLKFKAVSTGLRIPLYYSQSPLLIGFVLMGFYTLFSFFAVLTDAAGPCAARPAGDNKGGDA